MNHPEFPHEDRTGENSPTGRNPYSPGDYPQSGYPQSGYPQGNHPQGGFPPPGYPVVSPYPGAGARFGALVLDYLVVGVIVGIIGAFIVWNDVVEWINALERWDGYGDAPDLDAGKFTLVGILSIVIWFLYRVGMETTRGQTLGKMALKMKVVDVDGQVPTLQASLLRNSWYLISCALSFIPFLGWIANIGIPVAVAITLSNNTYRQSFTDSWAKTYVVSTRPTF